VFSVRRKKLTGIADAWIRLGWQEHDRDKFISLCSSEFINHSTSGSSTAAFVSGIFGLYGAFPDFYAKFGSQIVDVRTHKVAILWTGIGTHCGDMPGFPATGRTLIFRGIEIIRIHDDKVVERWGESDIHSVLARSPQPICMSGTID
jgi:predicted ester cyclase